MKINIHCFVAVLVLVAACTAVAEDKKATEETSERPCLAHFEKKGDMLLRGRVLTTWQEFTNVDYDTAFRKVAQATVRLGWAPVNATKDTGTITGGDEGGSINIVVSETGKSVIRVDAKIGLSPMNFFSDEKAQKALCNSVEAPAH